MSPWMTQSASRTPLRQRQPSAPSQHTWYEHHMLNVFFFFFLLNVLRVVSLFFFQVSPFYLFTHSFIHFWLCWAFVAARQLSPAAASGGCSSLQCISFSLQQLLSGRAQALGHAGFSSCPTACGILVPKPGMETPVPCIKHWTTGVVRLPYSSSLLTVLASFHQASPLRRHTPLQRPASNTRVLRGVISSTRVMDPGSFQSILSSLISLPAHPKAT